MSIRNLDYLLKPASIALVGATKEPRSVGAILARNLFKFGFDGPIMPVNPQHRAIEGVLTYADAADLPEKPDLVVIASPPPTVPGLITEFAEKGARAAIVVTAGFGDAGDEIGRDLGQAMLDAAKPHTMRILGPNCLGLIVPGLGLNASFAHINPIAGDLAFVAQSGTMVTSVLDWATARGIGFSHFVSLGDMSDVDFGDMLDYLASEPETRGVLLYIESVTDARKFMSAARAAARIKPVIVIKAGRSEAGARAASSHTGALSGALAGLDAVYDAAFRRAGMLRVDDIGGLFGAIETLAMGGRVKGDRLVILSNGGGVAVMATDALADYGGRLAELSEETIAALDGVLPPTWSHANPIDIIGDAPPKRYAKALEVVLKDPGAEAVLVLNCPMAIASSTEAAQAVIDTVGDSKTCVLTSWLGENTAHEARRRFAEHRIPSYFTPERAVRAFTDIVKYKRNQEALMETPPSVPEEFEPDSGAVRAIIDAALAEDRGWLTEPEVEAVLSAYGIPVVETRIAADPQAAAAAAADLGGPVVLKILSTDIIHKSDVGGVALDLHSPAAVRDAADEMLRRIGETSTGVRVDGFTVQPMVSRPGAYEVVVGMTEDPQFGPVILFGHGGTAIEIIDDTALALPPLNMRLACDLIADTRVYDMLKGFRGRPAADLQEIALTLIKVSQLVIDFGEIAELVVNPLVADAFGVIGLDARVAVRRADGPAAARLAIRPYPKALEEVISVADGRTLLLRPVRPEDEPAFHELFAHMSPEDIRMRFFASKRVLSHATAAHMTQIDYDREMALVLADPGTPGQAVVYGVVHITADPDGEKAEYAIMVRSDLAGQGMGSLLMQRIIDYARSHGIKEIVGDVLRENKPMLRVCDLLNFSHHRHPDDLSVINVRLKLNDDTGAS